MESVINDNIMTFKNDDKFTYMTEHKNISHYGKIFYKNIIDLNMIDSEMLADLINLNDLYGGTIKEFIHKDIPKCSTITLRYIFQSLLTIQHIKQK